MLGKAAIATDVPRVAGPAFTLLAVAARLAVAGGAAFGTTLAILALPLLAHAVLALAADAGGVMTVRAVGVEEEEPIDD
jgi:hypothetical protein